jgi:hypothetical protein
MVHRGIIKQPYKGAYCDKITYDVRFVPLLAHNVRLHFFVEGDLESWVFDEVVGDVEVHVCFGAERRKVSGWLKCDRGMNKSACLFAVDRWLEVARGRLGYDFKDLVLSSAEFNKDYAGLKIDGGFHCATKKVLRDTLERVYQKEEGVRHEFKVSKCFSLTQFEQFFDKGIDEVNGAVGHERLLEDIQSAQKFANRQLLEIKQTHQAIVKRVVSFNHDSECIDALRETVCVLGERVEVLTQENVKVFAMLDKLLSVLPGLEVSGGVKPLVGDDYSR